MPDAFDALLERVLAQSLGLFGALSLPGQEPCRERDRRRCKEQEGKKSPDGVPHDPQRWVGLVSIELGGDAPWRLLRAASRIQPHDPDLARETYLNAFGAAIFSGEGLLEICRAARTLIPAAGPPRAPDLLLDGLTLLVLDGHAAAAPLLQRATEALAPLRMSIAPASARMSTPRLRITARRR